MKQIPQVHVELNIDSFLTFISINVRKKFCCSRLANDDAGEYIECCLMLKVIETLYYYNLALKKWGSTGFALSFRYSVIPLFRYFAIP